MLSEVKRIKILTSALKTSLSSYPIEAKLVIKAEVEKLDKRVEFLKSRKPFLYSFVGGGWNSCYAVTIDDAIKGEKKRWKASGSKLVDKMVNFRLSTDSEEKSLMSLFY